MQVTVIEIPSQMLVLSAMVYLPKLGSRQLVDCLQSALLSMRPANAAVVASTSRIAAEMVLTASSAICLTSAAVVVVVVVVTGPIAFWRLRFKCPRSLLHNIP